MSSEMETRDWIKRLRAASLLVVLLAVPVFASATLAVGSSDVCSMSCCVNEGHCCCSPQRSRVKSLASPDRESIDIAQAEQCPGGCAALSASTFFLRAANLATSTTLGEAAAEAIHSYDPSPRHGLVDLDTFSPRAPPELSNLSA